MHRMSTYHLSINLLHTIRTKFCTTLQTIGLELVRLAVVHASPATSPKIQFLILSRVVLLCHCTTRKTDFIRKLNHFVHPCNRQGYLVDQQNNMATAEHLQISSVKIFESSVE